MIFFLHRFLPYTVTSISAALYRMAYPIVYVIPSLPVYKIDFENEYKSFAIHCVAYCCVSWKKLTNRMFDVQRPSNDERDQFSDGDITVNVR